MFHTLTRAEENKMRLDVLYRDFERVDTVLAQREISVKTNTNTSLDSVLAYSPNNRQIVIGRQIADSIETVDDVIGLTGVNYHELCHQIYTYEKTYHAIQVRDRISNGYGSYAKNVWNALEDQRIETLFIKRFRPTAPYFVTMAMSWLLNGDDATMYETYPILVGRKYLDQNIVKSLGQQYAAMKGDQKAAKVADCVRRYVALGKIDTKAKEDEAYFIVLEMVQALTSNEQANMEKTPSHSDAPGAGDGVPYEESQNADGSSQGQSVGKYQPRGPKVDSEEESKGSDKGEASDSDGDDSDNDGGSAPGSGDGSGQDDSDQDADGNGNPHGHGPMTPQEVRDLASWAERDAINDRVVQEETQERLRVAKGRKNAKGRMLLPLKPHKVVPVKPELAAVQRRLARTFSEITFEVDPGRVTHEPSGKVSMKRAMGAAYGQPLDYDTVYDRWQEGQEDATDMEVVVLVDCSTSMRSIIGDVSDSLWAIQSSIESVSSSCTFSVIGFSTQCFWVVPRGTRADKAHKVQLHVYDYTHPLAALTEARNVFASSTHTKGLLVVITDGVWSNEARSEDAIDLMNAAGVTTSLVFISDIPSDVMDPHHCQIARQVTDPHELAPFAKDVVAGVLRSKSNR